MRTWPPLVTAWLLACSSHDSSPAPASLVTRPVVSPPVEPRVPRVPELWGGPQLPDENPDPNVVEVRLRAERARATVDGKEIDVLAYNGVVPGPRIVARAGERLVVHFENALDEPTTVHWHGIRVPEAMDGSPRIQTPVPPQGTFRYEFVVPDAGTYWYHPHVETHAQLERGLYGPIVVLGNDDPAYDLERTLVLDDVLFDEAGAIAPPILDGLTVLTGRWGTVMLTNGRNAKEAKVTARRGQVERWRIINTANARHMLLEVEGARARLIGADGGLLPQPLDAKNLVLPVGGRLELEVAYDAPGAVHLWSRSSRAAETERTAMLAVDVADGPEAPRNIAWPAIAPVVPERAATSSFSMTFDFVQTESGSMWTVNGEPHPSKPVLEVPQGSTVKISLSNAGVGVGHPFHLHGQFFRVLHPDFPGLRDSVQIPSTGTLDIIAYLDNPGRWMAHCHILEHAERGMMAELVVGPSAAAAHGH